MNPGSFSHCPRGRNRPSGRGRRVACGFIAAGGRRAGVLPALAAATAFVCAIGSAAPSPAQSLSGAAAVAVLEASDHEPAAIDPVVSCVAVDPAGKTLVTVGDDHLVRVWRLDGGVVAHRLAEHRDWVRAAALRPGGGALATAGDDGQVRLWSEGERWSRGLVTAPGADRPAIRALGFSPDGRLLAAGGFGERLTIYDGQTGEMLRQLDAPAGGGVATLAFAPDGSRLAAAGRAGVIRIWDPHSGQQIADIEASPRRISALAWSPDGTALAAAGQERSIRIWDPATGRLVTQMPEQPSPVLSLVYCGQGRVAAGGTDNMVRIWDLENKREAQRLAGHTGSVATLAYLPEAATLVSAGFDTTVRLWRLGPGSGQQASTPSGQAATR
jgi:WD40 repeat protein